MNALRLGYWLITGAVLGLGLVEIAGLGLVLFPIGVVLLVIGLVALRGREALAGIVGFGALPTAAFVYAIATFAQPCVGLAGPYRPYPVASCNAHVPIPPFYYGGAIVFGVITLVGVVVLVAVARVSRRGPRTGTV
jgi:hypothetical protein